MMGILRITILLSSFVESSGFEDHVQVGDHLYILGGRRGAGIKIMYGRGKLFYLPC